MKSYMLTSALTGILLGVAAYFICLAVLPEQALMVALAAGALAALLMLPALVYHEKTMNKKYAAFEASIQSPVFFKANGNFNMACRVRNGNIYFCDKGIIFAALDQSPAAVEQLLLPEIERYEFDASHMNVFAKDGRSFLITTPDAQKILAVLKEAKWID